MLFLQDVMTGEDQYLLEQYVWLELVYVNMKNKLISKFKDEKKSMKKLRNKKKIQKRGR